VLPNLRIILTAAGCPGWGDIASALRNNGERAIDIIAVDMAGDAYGYHLSEHWRRVPPGNDPDYIPTMLDLAEEYEIDAIVPLADPELLPLAENKALFRENGVVLSVADAESLRIVCDKISLYGYLNGKSNAIPDYRIIDRADKLRDAAESLGYPDRPLCFKPGVAHGSRGFRILSEDSCDAENIFSEKVENMKFNITLDKAVEFLDNIGDFPPLLLMPVFPGEEYSVDLLISNGKILSTVCRLREKITFGLTGIGEVVDNPDVLRAAEEIAILTGLEFNANIQLKIDTGGTPRLLEINPRTSGTIALCVAAGVNLPYLGLKLALNEPVEPVKPLIGVRSYRYWTQVFTYDKNLE